MHTLRTFASLQILQETNIPLGHHHLRDNVQSYDEDKTIVFSW